jgi:hypothetical protein
MYLCGEESVGKCRAERRKDDARPSSETLGGNGSAPTKTFVANRRLRLVPRDVHGDGVVAKHG